MFENIQGLNPQRAAQLTLLVEQGQALLQHGEGMDAVQRLLSSRGTGVLDSILVTRQLLGAGQGDLAEAKRLVLTHPTRAEDLRAHQHLVDLVQHAQDVAGAAAALPTHGRATTLVAIDGASGSGKTTLAEAAAELLDGCPVVAADDFYRPMPADEREHLDPQQGYDRYFDWQRLRDQVLVPLRAGHPARYRRFDWAIGKLGAWHVILPEPVILVEGVYVARPELAAYYHLTVYVDTPRETCLRRMRARGQNPDEWITLWRAAEDHYLRTTWPQTRLHMVIPGH